MSERKGTSALVVGPVDEEMARQLTGSGTPIDPDDLGRRRYTGGVLDVIIDESIATNISFPDLEQLEKGLRHSMRVMQVLHGRWE